MGETGRWTKAPGGQGVDPRDDDADFTDEERAAHRTATRPVVHDQEPTGDQGITTDRPGTDAGPYGKPRARDASRDEPDDSSGSERD